MSIMAQFAAWQTEAMKRAAYRKIFEDSQCAVRMPKELLRVVLGRWGGLRLRELWRLYENNWLILDKPIYCGRLEQLDRELHLAAGQQKPAPLPSGVSKLDARTLLWRMLELVCNDRQQLTLRKVAEVTFAIVPQLHGEFPINYEYGKVVGVAGLNPYRHADSPRIALCEYGSEITWNPVYIHPFFYC